MPDFKKIKEKQADNPYYLPLPYEVVSYESGYQESVPYTFPGEEEIMEGNSSTVAKFEEWLKTGFYNDKTRNWFCIQSRLAAKKFSIEPGTLEIRAIAPLQLPFGLTTDPKVKLKQPLYNFGVETRRRLIAAVTDDSNVFTNGYQLKITAGLVDPEKDTIALKRLSDQVQKWENPDKEYTDRNLTGEPTKTPRKKLIPRADQFPESVRQLSFGDIFTLFQGAELESVQLALGRACVGHPGTVDPDTKQVLTHTYRQIAVISGNAGIGKSTLFDKLNHALRQVGYDIHDACPSLDGRFNLREGMESDILFRDDATTDGMIKELTSATAKILATNGHMATEEKGKDAQRTKCKTMVFYLANNIDNKLFWHMDWGSRSRVKLIECVPEGSVSPEKLPFTYIPALAKEHNVSEDTIMLWACRLATDHFLQFTGDNATKLEAYVKSLETRAHKSNADPLDGIMASIVLGYMLKNPNRAIPKKLNCTVLAEALITLQRLKQDEGYLPVSRALLETLEQEGSQVLIPAWHPVQGLKRLDPASLAMAYDFAAMSSKGLTPNDQIKRVFSSLSLDDGNQCYGSPGTVIPRYSNLVNNQFTLDRIKALADSLAPYVPSTRVNIPASVDHDRDIFWNM